jgi:hypothetical protein
MSSLRCVVARAAVIFSMQAVPNWSLESEPLVARSFWRTEKPAQPVPAALKPFITGTVTGGRMNGAARRAPSAYIEVVIPLNKAKIVKKVVGVDGFVYQGIKGLNLAFSFPNRAQNERYNMQTPDEIRAMIE